MYSKGDNDMSKTTVSFSLDHNMFQEFKEKTNEVGLKRSYIIERSIEKWLKDNKDDK